MGDDIFNDPFGTQSVTPGFNTLHTKGTGKLLVVIFVVDCSKTMSGDRIGAVNAAMEQLKYKLTEIKNDNSLDLRIAILSFASSAKWELELTPIEEVSLDTIHTRPGLTEYGAAFHELNKVLRKESYMKHTGKIAPPAIMFLTDGEPEDDYQADLDELLKNGWFTNASRSAVLLGDAINNSSAKDAVSKFVNDSDADIVTAEDSTVIIQKIRIATMHTVAGDPMQDNAADNDKNPMATSNNNDAVGNNHSDNSDGGALTPNDDPFGNATTSNDDPFGGSFASNDDPFGGSSSPNDDPFGGSYSSNSDPFGDASSGGDPFGNATADIDNPFGDLTDGADPFGGGDDQFGGLI